MERCLERVEREGSGAIEAVCAEAPEHAEDLRRRLGMLEGVGLLDVDPEGDVPENIGGYRILELLGQGGMGLVYRAFDPRLTREVALKLLRPERLLHPGARGRFLREAEAAARLQHPGIVTIHGAGEHRPEGAASGVPFLAMELVEGRSLSEVLHDLGGRDPETLEARDLHPRLAGSWTSAVTGIVAEVAVALAHAHERGVLHRDVKPGNIVLGEDGRARLLDFGLARALGDARLTGTGVMVGSLETMAPEQLRGAEDLDARVDVFGLGATFYELLTLRSAFAAATPEETMRKIREGDYERPGKRLETLSKDVEAVCCQALEPIRSARYAGARELAEDLENLISLRPVTARRSTATRRAVAAVRRRPEFYASLALALGCLIALPLAVGWVQDRAARQVSESADRATASEARLDRLFEALFEAVDPDRLDAAELRGAIGELVEAGVGSLARGAPELADVERLLVLASTSLNRGAWDPARSALEAVLVGVRTAEDSDAAALGELELAASMVLVAVELNAGDERAVVRQAQGVLALDERLPEREPTDPERASRVASVHGTLAMLTWRGGDAEGAFGGVDAGLERLDRAPASEASDAERARLVELRGRIERDLGRVDAAWDSMSEARELRGALRRAGSRRFRADSHAGVLRALAELRLRVADVAGAAELLAEAVDVLDLDPDAVRTPQSATTGEVFERAALLRDLARVQEGEGARERALALGRRALSVIDVGQQRFGESVHLLGEFAVLCNALAGDWMDREAYTESIDVATSNLERLSLLAERPGATEAQLQHWMQLECHARYSIAASSSMSGDVPGALEEYERLVEAIPAGSAVPELRELRVLALLERGVTLDRAGQPERAARSFDSCERALDELDALVEPGPKAASLRSGLARCRANLAIGQGDFQGAAEWYMAMAPLLDVACETYPFDPTLNRDRREQQEGLVYIWLNAGEPERAHAAADRLAELGRADPAATELSDAVETLLLEHAPRSGD